MTGIVQTSNLQDESGTFTIPTKYLQRRIIQRTSYTHRVGWWRGDNNYYWVPGAYMDFRPARADSRIRVSFMVPTRAYGSAHMISHWIFYRDEVEYGRHSRSGHHVENAFSQEWDIPSWEVGQYGRIGYKFRAYSEGNHNAHLYHSNYWDGGGNAWDLPGQMIVEEYLPAWEGEVQVFAAVGTTSWTAPSGVTSVDVLVVGGGGGAGGVVYQAGRAVTPGASYTVVVGAGGYGAPGGSGGVRTDGVVQSATGHQFTVSATSGGNSQFDSIIAYGGGYGGSSYFQYTPNNGYGASGGSGGGASGYSDGNTGRGGSGTAGQGYAGAGTIGQYYPGGGGGAGGPGSVNPGNGGPGIANSILGETYYWGGGGGGSGYSGNGGNGGIGGGGGGAVGTTRGGFGGINNGAPGYGGGTSTWANTRGGDAGASTGGGGGGGSHYNATNRGGEGGSGVVILRWKPSVA